MKKQPYKSRPASILSVVMLTLFLISSMAFPVAAHPHVARLIDVGDHPYGIAVNSATNKIYVANQFSATVSVIDGASNNVIATIPLAGDLRAVAVNPVTNRIYVPVYQRSNILYTIDGTADTVVSTLDLTPACYGSQCNPLDVAVNSVTDTIYVSNSSASTIAVVDGATNTLVNTLSPYNGYNGGFPVGIGVNSQTNRIYVGDENRSTLAPTMTAIDGVSNTVLATIPITGYGYDIDVNPGTNKIYFANNIGAAGVVNGDTNSLEATVTVGGATEGIAVNPVENRIFVADFNGDKVAEIDGNTNSVLATVRTRGNNPLKVAVNTATNRVYVTNYNSNTVSVIVRP